MDPVYALFQVLSDSLAQQHFATGVYRQYFEIRL
ncbi:MAG: hypothetical protein ACJAZT_000128, partial [Gammaproteobacteria bacterium]